MIDGYNFLDPMNHSTYLMNDYPATYDEAVQYGGYLLDKNNNPKLKPQPTKDGYYKSDGEDDGKISRFEKVKAFLKGGTYNIFRGMFCDDKGFSIKRTLTTAAIGTAVALSGPIGLAIAGGIGTIASIVHLAKSSNRADTAINDADARKAYEGMGEGFTSAILSVFSGLKGFSLLKKNFNFVKANPELNIPTAHKYTKWNMNGSYAQKVNAGGTVSGEAAATGEAATEGSAASAPTE